MFKWLIMLKILEGNKDAVFMADDWMVGSIITYGLHANRKQKKKKAANNEFRLNEL